MAIEMTSRRSITRVCEKCGYEVDVAVVFHICIRPKDQQQPRRSRLPAEHYRAKATERQRRWRTAHPRQRTRRLLPRAAVTAMCQEGKSTAEIASELGFTQRAVQMALAS